jgi:lysozyme family protein
VIDLDAVVLFVIKQEDSTLSGIITNDPLDNGGTTRYGLTQKFHSELKRQGFFDRGVVPADRALIMAQQAYQSQYAQPLMLTSFNSQAIATAMLSFAVVEGNHVAVKCLQTSVTKCGIPITVDGLLGHATVDGANTIDQTSLLQEWINQENTYFETIVEHNSSQQRFLKGWEARAEKLKTLL